MNTILEYAIDTFYKVCDNDEQLMNYVKTQKIFELSANPNITFDDFKNNPKIDWCYNGLSSNPNMTFDIVFNNDKPWNYENLIKKLTFEEIQKIDKSDMYKHIISSNINITFKDIINCNKIEWDDIILKHPNLTMKEIDSFHKYDHLRKIHEIAFEYRCTTILKNPNIDEKTVIKCLDKPDVFLSCYEWDNICSSNIDILNCEYLMNKSNRSNWKVYVYSSILSFNTNVPNKLLKEEMIKSSFDWQLFSKSYKIDIDIALKYHNKVNWEYILVNPKISMFDIEKNIDKLRKIIISQYTWSYILYNPHITLDFIKKYINVLFDSRSIHLLFSNKFKHHPFFKDMKKTIERTQLLKEDLIKASCHPSRLFNWNEEMKDIFPEEYEKECVKYNSLFINRCVVYVDKGIIESCGLL